MGVVFLAGDKPLNGWNGAGLEPKSNFGADPVIVVTCCGMIQKKRLQLKINANLGKIEKYDLFGGRLRK